MAGGDTIMDFFMQELGVPGAQLLLAAEQTLYMVFLSLFTEGCRYQARRLRGRRRDRLQLGHPVRHARAGRDCTLPSSQIAASGNPIGLIKNAMTSKITVKLFKSKLIIHIQQGSCASGRTSLSQNLNLIICLQ